MSASALSASPDRGTIARAEMGMSTGHVERGAVPMPECPNCGREVHEGMNFCGHCGASLQSGAIDAMIEDARRTLSQNPDDASARYNLAIAYKLGGMLDLAVEEFERVAQLQPDFVDVHYETAVLHAKLGRRDKAAAALKKALDLDPHHGRAQQLLQRLQQRG